MFNDKRNLLTWLIPTLIITIVVPLLIFILITQCAPRTYTDDIKIAFKIGSLSVAWYGILIFIGFACAIALASLKLWRIYKVPVDPFYWFCLLGVPLAILGARIWSFVIGDASKNDPTWSGFFDFQNGGLAVEGGVMLVAIAGFIYFPLILKLPKYQIRDLTTEPNKVRQISIWVYVDAIVPAILLGQVIGRWGNYMNQEIYGSTITGSWANFVNALFPYMSGGSIGSDIKQPLFFIESFINFWGLILIYFVGEVIPKKRCGDLGIGYFLWYGIVRAILNPMRNFDYKFNGPSVATSIVWVVIGLILLILNHSVLPKMRKYKLMHTFWNRLRLLQLPFVQKNIDRTKEKIRELSAIQKFENEKMSVKVLQSKLTHLNDKNNILIQIKNNLKINFVRTDDEMLYYLGR